MKKNSVERPFLLLTQRRTGATFLASLLSETSSFDTVQHEPFNLDRQFGGITSHFIRSRDEHYLKIGIRDKLYKSPNLKHCFEVVPFEVTKCLISVAEELGYGVVLHLRRNELDRLLSLGTALACGVWGPKQAKNLYPLLKEGRAQFSPIDLDFLKMEAVISATFRNKVEALLVNRNLPYLRTSYEYLYLDNTGVECGFEEIFYFLGRGDRRKRGIKLNKKAKRYDSSLFKSSIPNYDQAAIDLSVFINNLLVTPKHP